MKTKEYTTINVALKTGMTAVWDAEKGEWDDYSYDCGIFIIKKDGAWVGIYNMDVIASIVVK